MWISWKMESMLPGGSAEMELFRSGSTCGPPGGHLPHHPLTTYDHLTHVTCLGPLALEFAVTASRRPEDGHTENRKPGHTKF